LAVLIKGEPPEKVEFEGCLWCFVLSQSANRIDELYYKGMRLYA